MTDTQTWLQGQGATVDIFIQDTALDHNGFQLPSSFAYKDSILDNYLLCYNGTLSVEEELNKTNISAFPNPFTSHTILQSDNPFEDATLTVYNSLGQIVKQPNHLSGRAITFHRDNLPSGLYFFRLTQDHKIITVGKLVITDD
ncbi:MAG: hypothetical protein A3K10_10170 [Bacteroidetes bacterium RIFCSPLOWO2_12_FULL_31_6]|nr:MAG: hypothetical protein A3K10_10170 [Bacteroidetes bacterium RIFCSPLOWO2_12_FULL_31_6]